MLEKVTRSRLGRTVVVGLTALVMACSPGRIDDSEIRDGGKATDDSHFVYSGQVDIHNYVDAGEENEGDLREERGDVSRVDTLGERVFFNGEQNYGEESIPEKRERVEVNCDETSPCDCTSIRTIRGTTTYARPVVSDYTIAFLENGNEVVLLDIPSEEMVSLAPLKGKELQLSGHFLSGVYTEGMSEGNCQLVDLVQGIVLYEGACPKDIDQTFYVSQEGEELVVGNSFFAEELAWLNNSVSVAHPRLNYKMETVTFTGDAGDDKSESIYLWKYVDELFFPLPKPKGARDSYPLLKDGSLLFTRDEGQGVIRLMRYDYEWDNIFEEFTSGTSYTKRAAFNGTTLVSVVGDNSLEGYNLKTGKKGVFDVGVDGVVPGVDALYVTWTKGGALVYCELKEEWKGEIDF